MSNGRTKPLLVIAEDEKGNNYEVVAKLRGAELTRQSQIAELVSALLAKHLGIAVPEPALVEISAEFATLPPSLVSQRVASSLGENFGSLHLDAGFTTWVHSQPLRSSLLEQAGAIFAFDLLLQNPDRRRLNPNLWTRADQIGVYDHELAFHFLHMPILGGPPYPWDASDHSENFAFMKEHVFYAPLCGRPVRCGSFESGLETLSDDIVGSLLNQVPTAWRSGNDFCDGLRSYLCQARERHADLMNLVKHLTAYSFVILRYVHDVVTGEFANVGVVMYAPAQRALKARFTISYDRLRALFPTFDPVHYRRQIRSLDRQFAQEAQRLSGDLSLSPTTSVEALVHRILPQDDSSLQWSTPGVGLSNDVAKTFQEVFARMVERYIRKDEPNPSRSDDDIAQPFKERLQKAHQRLSEKRIVAPDFQYEFSYAWKNAIWHVYQPLSFDLHDEQTVLDKANRWLGRGHALHDAPDRFKIHFLLGEPRRPEVRKAFASAKHLLEKIPGEKELVAEVDIEKFADQVAAEMAEHEAMDE